MTLTAPPEHRGRALGFLNAGIGVGFTVGPLVAGLLVVHLGWRSTFYVRVPIALAVFAWALAALPVPSIATVRRERRLDGPRDSPVGRLAKGWKAGCDGRRRVCHRAPARITSMKNRMKHRPAASAFLARPGIG